MSGNTNSDILIVGKFQVHLILIKRGGCVLTLIRPAQLQHLLLTFLYILSTPLKQEYSLQIMPVFTPMPQRANRSLPYFVVCTKALEVLS